MLLYKIPFLLILIGIFSIPFVVENVFGHGLGGDQAPPLSLGDEQVTVSTQLDPSDITVGEVDDANIQVRFFNVLTDETFEKVTYRVEIWRSGELLARDLYFDVDGILNVRVKPVIGCTEPRLIDCTTYQGTEHASAPEACYVQNEGRCVIQGPIFEKGGLYNIKVDVEGATSARTLLSQRLTYDTFVSVAQEQDFIIPTASAEIPVIIKTYYDDVENFQYKQSDNSISFDMPFNWDPDYISLVPVVHEEVKVPKSFSPYKAGSKFKGYVDGVEVDSRVIIVDPYSDESNNIVHFMVAGNELKRINDVLGPSHYVKSTMLFKLVPHGEIQKNSFDIKFDSGATVQVAWESSFGAGDEIPFEFTFFDENGNLLKDIRYGLSINSESGIELISNVGSDPINPGLMAMEGINTQKIRMPSQELYRIQVAIFGQGINYDQTYAGIAEGILEVGSGGSMPIKQEITPQEISIPDWVRNNAGWWAGGQIGDNDFASGIEYMIKEGIINVPTTSIGQATGDSVIPDWVRNNAGWWADGQISDEDFANGLQYLIKIGVISV